MARKRKQRGYGSVFRGRRRQRGKKQKGGAIFKPSTYNWLRQKGFGKQRGGAIGMGAMLALSMAPMLLNKIL